MTHYGSLEKYKYRIEAYVRAEMPDNKLKLDPEKIRNAKTALESELNTEFKSSEYMPVSSEEWLLLFKNFLELTPDDIKNYQLHENWFRLSPYEQFKKYSCLVGQIIGETQRELDDLDDYLRVNQAQILGWSISTHIYERLVGPHAFKMSRPRFFTNPYESKHFQQVIFGFIVGPMATSALAGLLALSLSGVCSPVFFIGCCCMPSLAYLIKGIQCLIKAASLACHPEQSKTPSLAIQFNLERAVSCLFIATLIPLSWSTSFPIELVRFISRSVSTGIELTKSCFDSDHTYDTRIRPA